MSSKFDKYLKDFEKPKTDVEHNPQFEKVEPQPKINENPNPKPQELDKDFKESIESIEQAEPKDSLSKYKVSTEPKKEKDSPDHELEH